MLLFNCGLRDLLRGPRLAMKQWWGLNWEPSAYWLITELYESELQNWKWPLKFLEFLYYLIEIFKMVIRSMYICDRWKTGSVHLQNCTSPGGSILHVHWKAVQERKSSTLASGSCTGVNQWNLFTCTRRMSLFYALLLEKLHWSVSSGCNNISFKESLLASNLNRKANHGQYEWTASQLLDANLMHILWYDVR